MANLMIGRPASPVMGPIEKVSIVHENYHEVMLDMGNSKLVTMGHVIKNAESKDVPAIDIFPNAPRVDFTGTVYNLEVFGPDHHYILENGIEAHNMKLP